MADGAGRQEEGEQESGAGDTRERAQLGGRRFTQAAEGIGGRAGRGQREEGGDGNSREGEGEALRNVDVSK